MSHLGVALEHCAHDRERHLAAAGGRQARHQRGVRRQAQHLFQGFKVHVYGLAPCWAPGMPSAGGTMPGPVPGSECSV